MRQKEVIIMKTNTIKESPVFYLSASSYNGGGEIREVSISMLKKADVGTKWESNDFSNCGRGVHEESIEVVYKNASGCAVLCKEWGTSDSPDPEDWENDPELIWVEFIA